MWIVSADAHAARAGELLGPRSHHAAVALADGRVLVLGGRASASDAAPYLDSTELWDPSSRESAPGPALRVPRAAPIAFRVGDGVVVLGGDDNRAWFRGETSEHATTAELVDPAAGSRALDVPEDVYDARSVPLDASHTLVVAMGRDHEVAWVYDAGRHAFEEVAAPAIRRRDFAVAPLGDGRVVVTGGTQPSVAGFRSTVLGDVEVRSADGRWGRGPDMPVARMGHAALVRAPGAPLIFLGGTGPMGLPVLDITAFAPR